jgi:hypothetical protein
MAGPKKSEEEWFAKFEIQMIRDAKRRREATKKKSESESVRPSNYELCPKDGTRMKKKHLGNIEVEICPKCEGIWLDRGELEGILLAHDEDKKGFFRKLIGFK